MNNWRLLLLAVVAVLQPIRSFTEPNFVDGHQECCEHRSNSITQDIRLYGTYRKTTPEERRLSTREGIREERNEARDDPLTRSRVRLSLERAETRISPESSVSATFRIARNQERRQHIDATEYRQTRDDQNRRTQSKSKNTIDQYRRDVLDSRRNKMARDDTTTRRIGNERLYRESLDSRDPRRMRTTEDLRRVSATRESMDVLRQKRADVDRDAVHRDSKISALRSASSLLLDNDTDRRTLDQGARDNLDDNRRSRSLDSRANTDNEQENLRSRKDSREDRRSNFRAISERPNERKQRDQNRESRYRSSVSRRVSLERISTDRRRDSRDIVERVDQTIRDIRGIDERQHGRDTSQRRTSIESRLTSSAERRQGLTRESRILDENVRPERVARRDGSLERRQESRVSRVLEATVREEKFERSDERRDERQKLSPRSLNRVSVLRSSRVTRFLEREYESRDSARFPERNVHDERFTTYRRYVSKASPEQTLHRTIRDNTRRQDRELSRTARRASFSERVVRMREDTNNEQLNVQQETRNENRASRDRTVLTNDRLQRIRYLEDNRNNRRDLRERDENRMSIDNERWLDHELSRTTRRASFDERISKVREDTKTERLNVQRETLDDNRASRERTVVMQRLTRDISKLRQKASRNVETNARLQRTRSLEHSRDNRREVRDENRAFRDNERRLGRELSRTAERYPSDERVSRMNENINNERLDVQREIRDKTRASRDRTVVQRLTRDISTFERKYDTRKTIQNIEANARLQRTRTLENIRVDRQEVRQRDENRASPDRISKTRLSREMIEDKRREARGNTRDSQGEVLNEVIRSHGGFRMGGRFEIHRQQDESRDKRESVSIQRQARVVLSALSVERKSREVVSRHGEINVRSERLWISRDDNRINERDIHNSVRGFRTAESRRDSRKTTERDIQPTRYNFDKRASHDMRIQAKLKSMNILLAKQMRTDVRRDAIDTPFRKFEFSKAREMDTVEKISNDHYAMIWDLVFYTMQGAYLCGLLMQMLAEKSNKGKSRNFTWWSSSSTDLLKID